MRTVRETEAPAFERELLASIEAVHRFALRLTRDTGAAEDLVQETFLRALAHRDQYTPGTNCRAWLFTICRNTFVKGMTRTAREVSMDDEQLDALETVDPPDAPAPLGQAGKVFERTELDDAIRRAVDKLPDEQRVVVALVDIEDQTYQSVAAILDIPVGTVRSRLFRARRQLQRELLAYAQDAGLLGGRGGPQT